MYTKLKVRTQTNDLLEVQRTLDAIVRKMDALGADVNTLLALPTVDYGSDSDYTIPSNVDLVLIQSGSVTSGWNYTLPAVASRIGKFLHLSNKTGYLFTLTCASGEYYEFGGGSKDQFSFKNTNSVVLYSNGASWWIVGSYEGQGIHGLPF